MVFFPCCVTPPPPLPKNNLYNEPINIHLCTWVAERKRGQESHPPLTKVHQNGWFGHEKQCQETGLNSICTTHRKIKIEKKKESAWRMKLRYKLKLEGFFFFLVRLSHSYWPPRILLYNGLSTFFYYNIIYLNFLLTKQNPGTTDQRCNRRSALCVFYLNRMSTLDGKGFRVRFMRGQSQSSMYSHRSFS